MARSSQIEEQSRKHFHFGVIVLFGLFLAYFSLSSTFEPLVSKAQTVVPPPTNLILTIPNSMTYKIRLDWTPPRYRNN